MQIKVYCFNFLFRFLIALIKSFARLARWNIFLLSEVAVLTSPSRRIILPIFCHRHEYAFAVISFSSFWILTVVWQEYLLAICLKVEWRLRIVLIRAYSSESCSSLSRKSVLSEVRSFIKDSCAALYSSAKSLSLITFSIISFGHEGTIAVKISFNSSSLYGKRKEKITSDILKT